MLDFDKSDLQCAGIIAGLIGTAWGVANNSAPVAVLGTVGAMYCAHDMVMDEVKERAADAVLKAAGLGDILRMSPEEFAKQGELK